MGHGFGREPFNVSKETSFCQTGGVTQEEREIYNFLKATPEAFYSVREIGRRVGGKERRRIAPEWVVEPLNRMVRSGILETDNTGHYRLKPRPEVQAKGRKWVSPHIAKLLKRGPSDFSQVVTTEIAETEEDL